jgi:hypothetical protein
MSILVVYVSKRGIEVRQVYAAPDGRGWYGSANCSPPGQSGSR